MTQIKGEIEAIDWYKGPNRIYFKGYIFIFGVNIEDKNKIKKSIIISNGEKKFFIPLKNIDRKDITERFGNDSFNYDYSGFFGFIDIGFINDMAPITEGEWKISIYINTNGEELELVIPYNKHLDEYKPKELIIKKSKFISQVYLNKDESGGIKLKVETVKKSNLYFFKRKINNSKLVKKFKNTSIKIKKKIMKVKRKLGNQLMQIAYSITKKLNTEQNRVTFLSDSRIDFSGNFEFIYNELERRGKYDIRYILKPSINSKRTLKDKMRLLYYISTSKYILLDDYYPQIYKFDIKKDIEVIQLWHATGAFKTFGFSRLGKKGGPTPRSKNHRNYTKAIVSSKNIKKHYAEAFGISENKVISTGVPRTDIFFDEAYKSNKTEELYSKYPVLKNKKVIMFAPTFRGSGQKSAYYDFYKLDIKKLYESLGEEYIIIMKLHPFIKDVPIIDEIYKDFIIDLSNEREINDLLFISDILITDYSSVCFEYALLNRPMIFFAYDLEEYIASRDFYYPYESFVPGPIVRNTDEIIDRIKREDFSQEKLEHFRNKFFDHFDGKSTQRVVDMLIGSN